PSAKVAPLVGVQLTATTPLTVSAADAVKVNAAPVGPVASIVAFAGTVTMGPVVSLTVTVNEPTRLLPCVSVAVHVTSVAAIGNVAPLAGVQFSATAPSTPWTAVGLTGEAAPCGRAGCWPARGRPR